MKLLLIGPYPPPHGGISVHVAEARRRLAEAGVAVRVLNTDRRAEPCPECITFSTALQLVSVLMHHARRGWTFHVHTNGHNRKSWLVALLCGLVGRLGKGSLLTLHSGMTPSYLASASIGVLVLARLTCSLYDRVIGVNADILQSLVTLGVARSRTELLPAYLAAAATPLLPASLEEFLQSRQPVCSSVLFFRPEYGFDLLLHSLVRLRTSFPNVGCLVLGSGEGRTVAQQRVAQEGLSKHVLLLGDVPHGLCLSVMARSSVFVRCTLTDGDAISVREALSLGVPVVASDVGHRPAGALLFPSGDAAALASQLEAVLRRSVCPARRRLAEPGAFPRLLELYRQFGIQGAR